MTSKQKEKNWERNWKMIVELSERNEKFKQHRLDSINAIK